MRRAQLKFGVYEEKAHPERRVALLEGPDRVWISFNGTNYPAVMCRTFNQPDNVKLVFTETQFRDRYKYLGRYTTIVSHKEVLT